MNAFYYTTLGGVYFVQSEYILSIVLSQSVDVIITSPPYARFFFSSRRRHTRYRGDWSSDVCSSDLQRELERAVHEDGRLGLLEGAGERDADVRVLALARAVDDAPHHRDLELFHARVLRLPHRHLFAEVGLDLLGHLLEEGRSRAPAAGAGRHLRQEAPEPHGLEDLLGDQHLFRPVAAGLGGERHADRVAESLLEQDREPGSAGDDALGAHARFGQPKVQGVVGARRELAVDVHQVLDARDLGRG